MRLYCSYFFHGLLLPIFVFMSNKNVLPLASLALVSWVVAVLSHTYSGGRKKKDSQNKRNENMVHCFTSTTVFIAFSLAVNSAPPSWDEIMKLKRNENWNERTQKNAALHTNRRPARKKRNATKLTTLLRSTKAKACFYRWTLDVFSLLCRNTIAQPESFVLNIFSLQIC